MDHDRDGQVHVRTHRDPARRRVLVTVSSSTTPFRSLILLVHAASLSTPCGGLSFYFHSFIATHRPVNGLNILVGGRLGADEIKAASPFFAHTHRLLLITIRTSRSPLYPCTCTHLHTNEFDDFDVHSHCHLTLRSSYATLAYTSNQHHDRPHSN